MAVLAVPDIDASLFLRACANTFFFSLDQVPGLPGGGNVAWISPDLAALETSGVAVCTLSSRCEVYFPRGLRLPLTVGDSIERSTCVGLVSPRKELGVDVK